MVDLRADLERFREAGCTGREEHEFLESELVAGMGSAVDDVEAGEREDERWLDAGKVSKVLVERDTLLSGTSLSDRNRDPEDCVGAEFALIRGSVEFDKEVIDFLLLGHLQTRLDESRGDDIVNVGDSLADTWKREELAAKRSAK